MSTAPAVSVVLLAGGPSSAAAALRSVIAQEGVGPLEVLVGLANEDGEAAALAALLPPLPAAVNVVLHRLGAGSALTASFEAGVLDAARRRALVLAARHRLVAVLDDTHRWQPGHLRALLAAMPGKTWAVAAPPPGLPGLNHLPPGTEAAGLLFDRLACREWLDGPPGASLAALLRAGHGEPGYAGRASFGRDPAADAPMGSVGLTAITTCKGRLHHLKRSLPLLAAQGIPVVVVDYDCPQGTGEWVRAHHPGVRVVQVAGEPRFHHARARNLGAAAADTPWLLFIDADILVRGALLPWAARALRPGGFYMTPVGYGSGLSGTHFVARVDLESIRGYDEAIDDWGGSDEDCYLRHLRAGREQRHYANGLFEEITHDDAERFVHLRGRDRGTQLQKHALYCSMKYDAEDLLHRPLSLAERRALRQRAEEVVALRATPEVGDDAAFTQQFGPQRLISHQAEWEISRQLTWRVVKRG